MLYGIWKSMNQITKLIMKVKGKEKYFLYFSYIANIAVICILVMIATGIKNITNESLSKSDMQQIEAILSSVIFISIIAIVFFQWIISMQFGALLDSRKQFNNNMRLMGIPNKYLLNLYMKEMFCMQPFSLIAGVAFAEVLYFIISSIMQIKTRFILIPQIVLAIIIHIVVITICIGITYKKMIKRNIIDELRGYDERDSIYKFSLFKKIEFGIGLVLLIVSVGADVFVKNSDIKIWVYIGIINAVLMLYDFIILNIHRLLIKLAKMMRIKRMLFSEYIAVGYLKKSKVVCGMIVFSAMLFLGMQMLYKNVRVCASDVVEANIHYEATVWFDEHQNEINDAGVNCGLKYKLNRNGSVWYIMGVDTKFFDNYETIKCQNKSKDISNEIVKDFESENWNGIILPNYYIKKSEIGSKLVIKINGKDITFKIAGAYYNNNFAHLNCYVSKAYLQKQLGLKNSYNIAYLKAAKDLAAVSGENKNVTQSFEEIRQESYEKAVSGTGLVEMVSIVIIVCAILSLMNYIMLSSKPNIIDISRFRGIGLSKKDIYSIYILESTVPIIISMICAIPLSILFAKVGCYMVFDAGYFKRGFIIIPSLMLMLVAVFTFFSVLTQLVVMKKVMTTDYYINVLRDVND